MKEVSREHSHEIMAKLTTNVDWSVVPRKAAQAIVDDPTRAGREFTRFLKRGGRVSATKFGRIAPPEGGEIFYLTLLVDESRPWREAVRACSDVDYWNSDFARVFRNDPADKDYDIWPATAGATPTFTQVVLVRPNFPHADYEEEVLAWGRKYQLRPASPRTLFAIGEHYQNLNHVIEVGYAIVSLVPCKGPWLIGYKCYLYWRSDGRGVGMNLSDGDWYDNGWFAFVEDNG